VTTLPVVLLSGAPASGKSTLSHLVARELRAAVIDLAVDNLTAGMPVVLVAPFTAERAEPAAWVATHDRLVAAGGAPMLVWLRLEPTEMLRRLRERASDRDAAKLADEAAYLSGAASTACQTPVVPHLALDATLHPAELARAILHALPR